MKKILLILVISLFALSSYSQKFGHVNVTAIFDDLPEKAEAAKAIESYAKTLEDQMLGMQKELEEKYTDYQSNSASWSPAVKEMKEEDLMSLQQRIQKFPQIAQKDIALKESSLLEPIYSKITDAIKKVGEEKKLTYVFNSEAILYNSSESIDLTSDVKTKLGIKD